MEEQRQYVGIDLHRRRTVIVRMAAEGEVLDTVRIHSEPLALAKAGPESEVAMEATLGWYWAADVWPTAVPAYTWPTRSASRRSPTSG